MSRPPTCPTCAAPLPFLELQEIVTCEYCGSDVNAEANVVEQPPLRSPPLSPEGQRGSGPDEFADGPLMHFLLSEDDPAVRLERARLPNRRHFDEGVVLWLPALLEALEEAEAAGQTELAAALLSWVQRAAGSLRATRCILRHVRDHRVGPDVGGVSLGLIACTGIAGLATLVDLGKAAEAQGKAEGVARVNEAIRSLQAETWSRHVDVLFDMHTWLIPRARGAVRRRLIDNVADLADMQLEVPGEPYPVDWRGPDDMLTLILLWIEDLNQGSPARDNGDLAREVLERVVAMHHRSSWHRDLDLARWQNALASLRTSIGRRSAVDTLYRIFGPPLETDEGDPSPSPDLSAYLADTEAQAYSAVGFARARHGRVTCPTCGRPLELRSESLIVICEACDQPARVAREARHVRKVVDASLAARLQQWTPERLVTELLETHDVTLRAAIVEELLAVTTDGARYVEYAPALVRWMLSDAPPELEEKLGQGLVRMLQHRDPTFTEALFAEVRKQAFTVDGSDALLRALESAGPGVVPLLFDLVDHATHAADEWAHYAGRAQSIAFNLLSRGVEDAALLEARAAFLLERLATAGPVLGEELPSFLGHLVFAREVPCGGAQERLLRFIDRHTEPARVSHMRGLFHARGELFNAHYSWTHEELERAAAELGTTWTEAAETGGYVIFRIFQRIAGKHAGGPNVRQMSVLASQVESFWEGPWSENDLRRRIELCVELEHIGPRLLVLNSVQTCGWVVDPGLAREVAELLSPLAEDPHLAPSVAHVLGLMREPAQGESPPSRPTLRPWWRFWGL